jgi:photosystem II stability/assembly factor-like uncharacterized protein
MKFKALSCCIALLLLAGSAFAQWNTEYARELPTAFYAVEFPSSTVGYMVGSGGAIYKTTDGGDTWVQQTSPTTVSFFDCFFKNETEGWAVGDNGVIAVTTDGTNWALHDSSQVMVTVDINTVYFVGNSGWIGLDGGGIYMTTNNGVDWTVPTVNVATDDVNEINFVNATDGVAAIDGAGIMHTTDGGDTWALSAVNLGVFPYSRSDIEAIRMIDATYGVATGWGSMISVQPTILLVTDDGGLTWSNPHSPTFDYGTHAYGYGITDFDDGHALIVGGGASSACPVLHSDANYTSWTASNSFFGDDVRDCAAVPGTNRVVAVGDEGCVALSTDKGYTWDFTYLPSPGTTGISKFAGVGKDMILAVAANGMFFKGDLTTVPVTWDISCVAPEHWAANLEDVAYVEGVIYVSGKNGYFCKSTDMGETWTQLAHTPDNFTAFYGMHWFDADNGVLVGERASEDVIYTTSNGGGTLVEVSWNVVGAQLNSVSFSLDNPLNGVTAGDDNVFMYTTNGGAAWTAGVEDIADGADDLEECHMTSPLVAWAAGDDGTICKTTDGGANWTMQTPLNLVDQMDVYFSYPTFGWICGNDGYAMYTDDGGASWNDISEPTLGTADVNAIYLHAHGGKLWIGADYGTMMTRTDGATDADTPTLPFKLGQNFPNPFNPSTRIKFSLRHEGRVTLNVYDVSGRLVAKVLDRDMPAGDHEVGFMADGLASGVYFYRLNAGGDVLTKKMILLR